MSGNPFDTQYDGWDEPACIAVVEAVADATDRDALSLPPIQETVETDALDALLADDTAEATVTFTYAGCRVEADSDRIVVRTRTDD